jgi:hypothetical protein
MTGKWRIALIAAATVVVVAGGVIGLRYALGPDGGLGGGDEARIQQVLEDHEAEFRALPGLTGLGIYTYEGGPPRIVLSFSEVTPEIEAAVPDEIDGFAVVIEEDIPGPPTLSGVVKTIAPASHEVSPEGYAGTLTIEGELHVENHGSVTSSPGTFIVNVPSDLQIWRPMGEGKEFIEFADIRTGDACQVTLKAVPAGQEREVTAADLEVYDRI